MRINPTKSGAAEFLAVYNEAFENYTTSRRGDPKRLFNLRCSQLPFCPSSTLVNYARRGMMQTMDLRMAYYVSVGTAVHEVMQAYLAQSGRFLADYHCRECGKKYPLSHQHECCGFPTAYDEVAIDYKGIQGHIDGIFRDSRGFYHIIDYKTTSLEGAPKKRKNPGAAYSRQVKAYALLLWKQYKIKVVGVMLVFIPRDNPVQPVIWEHKIKEDDWGKFKTELLADRNLHRKTMVAKTIEDMVPLLKHKCGGEYCDHCKTSTKEKVKLLTKLLNRFPIKEKEKM